MAHLWHFAVIKASKTWDVGILMFHDYSACSSLAVSSFPSDRQTSCEGHTHTILLTDMRKI